MAKKVDWLKQSGDKIDQFTVISPIGSGGMGQVYLCHDEALNRQVALKLIAKKTRGGEELFARFFQEGRVLAKIHHPNITTIYSLGQDDTCVYLAMEYVDGDSLFKLVRQCRLNLNEILQIIRGVAVGLQEAHKLGIVHRDIKPANIIVDRLGNAKLIDFGIAKAMQTNNEFETETGTLIGTMNYIAPELFDGQAPTVRSDVYALGLVLYELMTGNVPFASTSSMGILEKIRASMLVYPGHMEPMLPPTFRAAVDSAVKKNVEGRTQTMAEFIEMLDNIDLSHIPDSYCLPLREIELENRDGIFAVLEKAELDRAEWPLVISRALSKSPSLNAALVDRTANATIPIEFNAVTLDRKTLANAVDSYKAVRGQWVVTHSGPHNMIEIETRGQIFENRISNLAWILSMAMGAYLVFENGIPWNYLKWTGLKPPARTNVVEIANPRATDAPDINRREPTALKTTLPAFDNRERLVNLSAGQIIEGTPGSNWESIESPNPKLGMSLLYSESFFFADGQIKSSQQRWDLIAFENLNLKWRVQEVDINGKLKGEPWTLWYRPNGNIASLIRSQGSPIYGNVTFTVVGNPDSLFPLRHGKAVAFELIGQLHNESKAAFSTKAHFGCEVKDLERVNLATGSVNAVRVDCYLNQMQKPDIYYYAPELNANVLWRVQRMPGQKSNDGEYLRQLDRVISAGTGMDYKTYLMDAEKRPAVQFSR